MIIRYLSSIVIASAITFGLFFVMQLLVASGDAKLNDDKIGNIVDMVRIDRDESIQKVDRKPERPKEIEETPPELDLAPINIDGPSDTGVSIPTADVVSAVVMDGTGLGSMDGEYLPIVKVQPIYPRRAQERGISGSVLVKFTVTETGSVENVVVIEADPPGYFERAAIKAAEKFKYKPKVINGTPQRTEGVRNLFTFAMEE